MSSVTPEGVCILSNVCNQRGEVQCDASMEKNSVLENRGENSYHNETPLSCLIFTHGLFHSLQNLNS